jgi:hypothetical protein
MNKSGRSFWGGFMKEFRALCEKDKVKIAISITVSFITDYPGPLLSLLHRIQPASG